MAGSATKEAAGGRKGRRKPKLRQGLTWRPGSPWIWYSFSVTDAEDRRHRFRRSTETANAKLAWDIRERERERAIERIKLGRHPEPEPEPQVITLSEAAGTWYDRVGQFSKFGRDSEFYMIPSLLRLLGAQTGMETIDDATVANLVRQRRVEHVERRNKAGEVVYRGDVIRPRTVNLEVRLLGKIRDWARADGYETCEWDPAGHRLKETPPPERFLDYDEARTLIGNIVRHGQAPLMYMLMTGLRSGNAFGTDWDRNISLPFRRAMYRGKGDRMVAIDLIDPVVRLLEGVEPDPDKRHGPVWWYGNPAVGCDCVACRDSKDNKLFGKPILSLRRSFYTARELSGLPDVRMHDLRHTVASWLLNSGNSLKLVQHVLGHTDISTSARYAHLEKQGAQAAMGGALDFMAITDQREEETG